MWKLAAAVALGLAPAAGGVAAGLAGGSADPVVLEAVVGTNDGFDISLNGPDGRQLSTLEAGTYTIVVHDRSRLHNFHLASNQDPTVDFRTDVDFVGDQRFTVTFKRGVRYVYACEPHFQTMFGSFFATAPTPPATTQPPPSPQPVRLAASVSAAGAVSLTPKTVRHGAVRITVVDRSKRANFHLVGPGVNRRTTRAFVGRATWNVRLRAGILCRFGSDPKLTRRLRVR